MGLEKKVEGKKGQYEGSLKKIKKKRKTQNEKHTKNWRRKTVTWRKKRKNKKRAEEQKNLETIEEKNLKLYTLRHILEDN